MNTVKKITTIEVEVENEVEVEVEVENEVEVEAEAFLVEAVVQKPVKSDDKII